MCRFEALVDGFWHDKDHVRGARKTPVEEVVVEKGQIGFWQVEWWGHLPERSPEVWQWLAVVAQKVA